MKLSVRQFTLVFCLLGLFQLAGTAPLHAAESTETKVLLQERKQWVFKEDGVTFNNQFAGARVSGCERVGADEYRLLIKPENRPVNNSAWYAFQVQAAKEKQIVVRVVYEGGGHRYSPKISTDGESWEPLATNLWQVSTKRTELTLQLKADTEPLWVAAQEVITKATLDQWMENVVIQPYITRTNIGRSLAGRDIEAFEINDGAPPNYVFLISRQHPPEVTGQLGLMRFIEALTVDNALGQHFRERFRVFVVPIMNPDGVYEGQWRHSLGGVDLNRDWVKFSQPETSAVRDAILELLKEKDAKPYLMIDFHSTDHDIFYTQDADAKIFPPGFTDAWLTKIKERLPAYEPNRSGAHNVGMPTSKYWGYEKFGIAAITFEFGDNTDRSFIRELTRVSAEEMMKLLIEADKVQNPPAPQ